MVALKYARGDAKLGYEYIDGPGVKGGMSYADVRQGYLNDCIVPSTLGTMAKLMNKDLANAFRREDDGTFTVTLQRVHRDGGITEYEYNLEPKFYVKDDGTGRYMKLHHGNDPKKQVELWPALMEAALAAYFSEQEGEDEPTYQALNDGGYASQVMSLLTGRRAYFRTITDEAMLWREVTRAVDSGRGACLGTGDDGRHYKGSGIVDDHSYSVLNYRIRDGVKEIQIRNPWGDTEPKGNGKDDGVFWLSLDKAKKYYETFESVV